MLTFVCQIERYVVGVAEYNVQRSLIDLFAHDQIECGVFGKAQQSQQVGRGLRSTLVVKCVQRALKLSVDVLFGLLHGVLDHSVRYDHAVNVLATHETNLYAIYHF
jgi:hypothetical protein